MKKMRKYDTDMEYHVWVRSLYMTLPGYELDEDYEAWYNSWELVLESMYYEKLMYYEKSKTEENATTKS